MRTGGPAPCTTRARRSCAARSCAGCDQEGLSLDVCTVRRAGARAEGRLPGGAHRAARLEQVARRAGHGGAGRARRDRRRLVLRDRPAGRDHRRQQRFPIPVMVRVTVGVEAHTHEFIATAHEDQKFGFSLAGGDAAEAVRRVVACRTPAADRPALAHRLADLRPVRLRDLRAPGGRPAQGDRRRAPRARRHAWSRSTSAAGSASRTCRRTTRPRPDVMAKSLQDIVSRECQLAGLPVPARGRRAGPGDRRAAGTSPSTRSAPSRTSCSTAGCVRRYVSVDGGMSDNIRTALYDADYTVALASRASDAPARALPRGRQALRERRCRGPRLLSAGGPGRRRPARGGRDRGVLLRDVQQLQPGARARPWSRWPDGASRLLLRRETDDDLMQLEMT